MYGSDLEYIISPYDASSRNAGSSKSLNSWLKILKGYKKQIIPRELADMIPYVLEHKIKHYKYLKSWPILIGGDHSLTYTACKALTSIYGSLNIVVFDAHHDSYNMNYLNHYTVFNYCKKYLNANIVLIGCRKDLTTTPYKNLKDIKFPCYISIDVDYFSPKFVPSVMDPVECNDDNKYSLENYQKSLESLPQNVVVGADIVEWFGSEEGSKEYAFIKEVHYLLIQTINNKNLRYE